MKSYFGENSKLVQCGNKLADLMVLNLITLVFCIPVITAGTAITAMHYVLLKIYRNQSPNVCQEFFHAFKRDFKQSTILWLIYLAVGIALGFDYFVVIRQGLIQSPVFEFIFYVIAALITFSLTWVFILLSRYQKTTVEIMKDSFIFGSGYFLYTLTMIALFLFPFILLIFFPRITPVIILIGISGAAFLQTVLYSRVFDKCEGVVRHKKADK